MKDKRGQVTVFIILGIILLFSTAFVFYIKEQVTEYRPEIGLIEDVPLDMQPIQKYITDCLERTATRTMIKTGLQGGYPDTAKLRTNELNPTEGNALAFSPGSDLKLPYWWYLSSSNNCEGDCELGSKRLDLTAIEKRAGADVSSQIKKCIDNFKPFFEHGFTFEEKGEITTNVTLGRTAHFFLNYPLVIKKGASEIEMSRFYSQVNVNFPRIYDFATAIANVEIGYNFLERNTMTLVSGYSGINKEIPPISESRFKPGDHKMWQKSKVKEKIEMLLLSYIPVLQVVGTTNFVEFDFANDIKQGMYDTMSLPIGDSSQKPYKELSAEFLYFDWWPIYFDIKGRGASGEIITAEQMSSGLFSWIGIKKYQNFYDISYPVVIELHDERALDGEGYRFMFALEVNVRNNKAITGDYQGLSNVQGGKSLLCNQNQRNSANITINVKDGFTNEPLDLVLINYICGEESCSIGYTEDGVLKTKLPICAGGMILPSKEGYRGTTMSYTAPLDEADEIELSMYSYQDKKIVVRKKAVYKLRCDKEDEDDPLNYITKTKERHGEDQYECFWYFNDEDKPLEDNEMAVITFDKIKTSPTEEDYMIAAVYYGNESYTTARLLPGDYKVDINLIFMLPAGEIETLKIPSRIITVDTSWRPFHGEVDSTIEEVIFDEAFPEGGLQLDSWTLTPANLYSGTSIVFYALNSPSFLIASGGVLKTSSTRFFTHEDLSMLNEVDEYSKQFRDNLNPMYLE